MNYKEELAGLLAPLTGLFDKEVLELLEVPKDESFGDYAFPCFSLSKIKKESPVKIAQEIAIEFSSSLFSTTVVGPYINFTIIDPRFIPQEILRIQKDASLVVPVKKRKRILIESPSPNTNKPLHLGHLRNMLLGKSLSCILKASGQKTHIVNVVNDRGVHICKSMLAYQKWGENKSPQEVHRKSDHFVGDWYVRFSQECKKSLEAKEQLEQEAQDLLLRWEEGEQEVLALWEKMNAWAYEGWEETFKKIGFVIDKNYFESKTYQGGKEIILQGLEDGVFEKNEEGAIVADLTDKHLDKKILLRSNGTSVYITQDINLAKLRYADFKFDELIYVVGNEQEYHFNVLFELFSILQFPFASSCKHFSYGMIELPEGKMKSREGTVVDTDDLLKQTTLLAKEAIQSRYNDLSEEEQNNRAHMISLSAISFFFLKHDPLKNFVFNPEESLSFEGETGPYVQYTYARISSILRKSQEDFKVADLSLLSSLEEKSLTKQLSIFSDVVHDCADKLKPNLLCNYLIALCQHFNKYYVNNKIIQDDKPLESARCALLFAIQKVIREGLSFLGISAPDYM